MQRLDPIDSPTPLPNVPGTHPNAVWADKASPFEDGPAAESFMHCTTKAWAHGMILPLDRIAKLTARSLTQRGISAAGKQELQWQQLLAGGRAFVILVSLMLRRGMASQIPFDNPRPIIDIPLMVMHTQRIRFANRKELFVKLVVTSYPQMIGQITENPPAPVNPGRQQKPDSFGAC